MPFFAQFLSAAKPTDQGEESVIVLLLVVVGGVGPFFKSHVQFFWVCKGSNFVSIGMCKGRNFVSIGV